MKSKIVPFLSGAMLVLGVGLLVMNQTKMDKMMKDLAKQATKIADKFKGKTQSCECNCETTESCN